jgi:hypothetical protein
VQVPVQVQINVRQADEEQGGDGEEEGGSGYWDGYGLLDDGENEEDEMRDVLDQFEAEVGGGEVEMALGSSRSFDALNNAKPEPTTTHTNRNRVVPPGSFVYGDPEDDDRSMYPDDEKTTGQDTIRVLEHDEAVWGGTERNSRWSGSSYSRTSVLDVDTSGETRERFVRRVEAMLDEPVLEKGKGVGVGRGMGLGVPPMPKLPVGLAARPSTATGAVGARPKWRF